MSRRSSWLDTPKCMSGTSPNRTLGVHTPQSLRHRVSTLWGYKNYNFFMNVIYFIGCYGVLLFFERYIGVLSYEIYLIFIFNYCYVTIFHYLWNNFFVYYIYTYKNIWNYTLNVSFKCSLSANWLVGVFV